MNPSGSAGVTGPLAFARPSGSSSDRRAVRARARGTVLVKESTGSSGTQRCWCDAAGEWKGEAFEPTYILGVRTGANLRHDAQSRATPLPDLPDDRGRGIRVDEKLTEPRETASLDGIERPQETAADLRFSGFKALTSDFGRSSALLDAEEVRGSIPLAPIGRHRSIGCGFDEPRHALSWSNSDGPIRPPGPPSRREGRARNLLDLRGDERVLQGICVEGVVRACARRDEPPLRGTLIADSAAPPPLGAFGHDREGDGDAPRTRMLRVPSL